MFTQDVEDFMPLEPLGVTPAAVSTPRAEGAPEVAGGIEVPPATGVAEGAATLDFGPSTGEAGAAPVPLTWGEASNLARGIAGTRDARSLRKVGMSIKEARARGRISEQERSDLEKLYRAKQLELTNASRPSIRRAS